MDTCQLQICDNMKNDETEEPNQDDRMSEDENIDDDC